ncbi:hypothetical protein EMCRGX_G003972 [Ephydatia muelleri]
MLKKDIGMQGYRASLVQELKEDDPALRIQWAELWNQDRTDPNYHADWSKYQAKSIKLGMSQFSPLFSQKAEDSMLGYGKRP